MKLLNSSALNDKECEHHLTKLLALIRQESNIIECSHALLHYAILKNDSDVHCEPYLNLCRIRLRIDGVLNTFIECSLLFASQMIARFKVMANLDSFERRQPQDGQILWVINNVQYTFRLATLPVIHGEKLVLRSLSSVSQLPLLSELGLTNYQQSLYQRCLLQPQGLILVTGPTGCGKSTTLYSGLHHINTGKTNILTLEDPIEIPIEGVNQTQLNIKAGLNYATMIRALLRQDPDVIMLGEIRDKNTAEFALEAALTGHLVLSTLHTKSCYETLLRLQQMCLPLYLIVASIDLIISQRLIRLLCQDCKKLVAPSAVIIDKCSYDFKHYQASGCNSCNQGYKGRKAIYQLLQIGPEIKQALLQQASIAELKILGIQQNCLSLFQQGLQLVEQGYTSFSELLRVVELDV